MSSAVQIQILDDDVSFLRAIERLLVTLGFDVTTFSTVEDFWARANPNRAACLILDAHLGTASGIDLMRDLFKSGIMTPVLLVTGRDSEQLRRMAAEAGCIAYLQKPVSANTLMQAVRKALALRRPG
ncbi:response regulator transcription factor [Mesorhizobium marinum]|uniref:response regulator transcription factor n=1 Tax=Mesorhizobium marinum TaxID=3228790 RepID=UPI003466F713